MKINSLLFLPILMMTLNCKNQDKIVQVGLYQTFEQIIENNNTYANKFNEVQLNTTFISPSGKTTEFFGFYDGDGKGGGNATTGNIWKMRFIPNEVGPWKYIWTWSDNTKGGTGSFMCTKKNAGKGILQAYAQNPRWFAYNSTEPVWLKSYYESGHGSIAQPLDWIAENVYQPIIDSGYNHMQVNWLLSLCCFEQYYHDGPEPITQDLALYKEVNASSTMRLDVWELMENHVEWLNNKNIGLHFFLGFDGSKNDGPKWTSLSNGEKDFYVRYVVARLAPYANIAGWSYVWEVPGDRKDEELGWARLIKKYDVFNHLRTYEDEHPKDNEYHREEYTFAAIENHSMFSEYRDMDRPYWKEPWTHHEACLVSYVQGKPVYMIEGNALWRRFWQKRTNATVDDLRQSAWGCVTAGASFNWCGQAGEEELVAFGPEGLPFHGDGHPYAASAKQLDVLSDVIKNSVTFYKMNPTDHLLSNHNTKKTWCLSEIGTQYLVFSVNGNPFKLQLEAGNYNSIEWVDSKTGASKQMEGISVLQTNAMSFTPPDSLTDWILVIKN